MKISINEIVYLYNQKALTWKFYENALVLAQTREIVKASRSEIFSALLLAFLLTLFGLLIIIGATLKETPSFWLNLGGYPEELRAILLVAFYPAYGIYFLWLTIVTLTAWRLLRVFKLTGTVLLLASGVNWLLLAISTTIVVWNNVENLLQSLPFHYHALLSWVIGAR